MRGDDVTTTVEIATGFLAGLADRDWSVPAGPLEWSCRDTGVHVADDLFGYAAQVAVGPPDSYPPFEIVVGDAATVDGLLLVIRTGGAMLATSVAAASPDARGWHPFGVSDPAGFAAMGVVEVLVHTHDIARGLGTSWTPPADACAAALARLWPDTDPGPDPAATLLHVTGRAALDGTPAPARWRWYGEVPG
ncbi:maleylpyruvate isomerase N-terminal domain-containing protein [Pseudonocardia nematodicida]|uniref:Maleylpyruvate isomerase N-terminal domain-containing protein n=1 Tax=Pseudonocardia nematodicida TaxID=1206997 RepID=A0ABV1KF17_9PSEU